MEALLSSTSTGFKFDNCGRGASRIKSSSSLETMTRNNILEEKLGLTTPKARKTGTTIAGLIFKDGVILGADTRATDGNIVADKNCSKIHYLAPNMYCCGAGTAGDTEMTTQMISSQLELHRLATGRTVPVVAANRLLKQMLFRYQGFIGAALVLGGVDRSGPHLYCIFPHGSSDKLPFVTMGSGSLAAMAMMEQGWKPEMELQDAKDLMREAIAGGIFNDLGSGSNVDICVITRDKVDFIRPYEECNKKGVKQGKYRYNPGTTAVRSTKIIPLDVEQIAVKKLLPEAMDTSA